MFFVAGFLTGHLLLSVLKGVGMKCASVGGLYLRSGVLRGISLGG